MKTLTSQWCTILFVCLSFNLFSFTENISNNFCSLDCNGQINLSLPETGFAVITPSMMSSASGCPGILEVHIMDANGVDIGNTVNCDYVGQILMVSVVHPATGNSCWGSVLVEDKLKPTINCVDTEVDCNEDSSPANTGTPIFSDNCSISSNPTFVDVMETLDCSDPLYKAVIKRTWTVTDDNGNTNSCEQNIFIKKLNLTQVTFPPAFTVDCTNPNLDPSNTGEPMVNGIPIGSGCNLMFTKTDGNPFATCGGGYKFIREWLVIEWCTNEIITGNQTIEITDTTPPVIICPDSTSFSTSSNGCFANVILPTPTVTDDCSNFTVTVDFNFPLSGNVYTVPAGTHPVTYTATDECGNSSSCTFDLTIKDLISPIAICDNPTQVSIGTDGTAQVCAITFDDGSTDNCGIDTFLVRKMDDPNFTDCVIFDCSEVGDTVMVVLRVIDECGNYNECMVEAIVDDKLPPTILCPNDLTIECTDLTDPITTFPTIMDNCGLDSMYFVDDSTNFNTCNLTGVILREWFAVDLGGLTDSCIQSITVEDNAELVFTFPEDDTISCTQNFDPDITGRPTVMGGCNDLIEAVLDSVRLNVDDCNEKLFIKWGFYDNCADTFLLDTAIQIIYIIDLDGPVLNGDTIISVFDTDNNCTQLVSFRIDVFDECSDIDTVINDFIGSSIMPGDSVSGLFDVGETVINFTAYDICGNESTFPITIEVIDPFVPSIDCDPVGIALLANESVKIDVASLIPTYFSATDCSPPVQYSFDASTIDDPEVTCDEVIAAGGIITDHIIVTATDGNGLSQNCQLQINIFCGGPLIMSGVIKNELDENLEDVMVHANADMNDMTNLNGTFYFEDPAMGNDYSITPEKNTNPLNGVTTYDLVLISKHILGIQLLDSPYKIIAADANRSGSLTALDLALFRSLILHSIDELPNNTSWRFIGTNYEFDNPAQPLLEDFPESMDCLNLTSSEASINFIGIKVGDVNGTASPNSFVTTDTREKEGVVILQTDNILLEKNKIARIPIFAKDLDKITGFQFTLNFDPNQLELLNIEKNILAKENFGRRFQDEGIITCSWIKENQNEISSRNPLFYLEFKAKNDLLLANHLWLNSKLTSAEAYNIKNKIYAIDLLFENNGVNSINHSDEILLFQNQPNPFLASTEIKFYTPLFTQLELQILDISGKIIHTYHTQTPAGIHQIDVDRSIFPTPGVYLYRLITPTFSASKKMILIN